MLAVNVERLTIPFPEDSLTNQYGNIWNYSVSGLFPQFLYAVLSRHIYDGAPLSKLTEVNVRKPSRRFYNVESTATRIDLLLALNRLRKFSGCEIWTAWNIHHHKVLFQHGFKQYPLPFLGNTLSVRKIELSRSVIGLDVAAALVDAVEVLEDSSMEFQSTIER